MSQWQPIATAPKDGTPILAWPCWVGEWEIALVHWHEPTRGRRKIGWAYYGNQLALKEPTHWMPLPTAPDEDAFEATLTPEASAQLRKLLPKPPETR